MYHSARFRRRLHGFSCGPAGHFSLAVLDETRKLNPEVDIEDAFGLKASLAFESDRMDPGHQDMGKNPELAPILAVIALLFASIGLYAVLAPSIGQRRKEIGVRMAIDAAAREIGRLVVCEGLTPVIIGLLYGLLLHSA